MYKTCSETWLKCFKTCLRIREIFVLYNCFWNIVDIPNTRSGCLSHTLQKNKGATKTPPLHTSNVTYEYLRFQICLKPSVRHLWNLFHLLDVKILCWNDCHTLDVKFVFWICFHILDDKCLFLICFHILNVIVSDIECISCPCGHRGRGPNARSRVVSVSVHLLFKIPWETPYELLNKSSVGN